ncbi:MAG: PDZ domain-containing protein [Cellvibrionales bacterium]|nr:PDZ domain-containing protein [Cellvibrionales bacterium]
MNPIKSLSPCARTGSGTGPTKSATRPSPFHRILAALICAAALTSCGGNSSSNSSALATTAADSASTDSNAAGASTSNTATSTTSTTNAIASQASATAGTAQAQTRSQTNSPPVITREDGTALGPTRSQLSAEGQTAVITLKATDPNKNPISWSLSGDDVNYFQIDSEGTITWKATPQYNTPRDKNTDNRYQITATATSSPAAATSLALTVRVIPSWKKGQFAPAADFKDKCQNPRSGTDLNGKIFPDKEGSYLEENFWLRSWSHENYLWYEELPDINPLPRRLRTFYPHRYFDLLKTDEKNPSGKPKDNFHFYRNTAEWQRQSQQGNSVGYGMRIFLSSSSPPRQAIVAYVVSDSPAAKAGIKRGAEIVQVNGVAVSDGDRIALNTGLFPRTANEQHSFHILDRGATNTRIVTLTSALITGAVTDRPLPRNDSASSNFAYLRLDTFNTRRAEKWLYDAFTRLANQGIEDLVVDLRYNGGGYLAISSQLAYMIAGPEKTKDKWYSSLLFNDKRKNIVEPFRTKTIWHTDSRGNYPPLPSLNLNRVFILSTARTCSASEELINGLIGIGMEVILIGEKTCGKPYGFYPTDNCGTTYFTIEFQAVNHKGFGDYVDGLIPTSGGTPTGANIKGCKVADDFSRDLGDPQEGMLKAALRYAQTGTCPPKPPAAFAAQAAEAVGASGAIGAGDVLGVTGASGGIEEIDPFYDPSQDLLQDPRIQDRLFFERLLRIDTPPPAN